MDSPRARWLGHILIDRLDEDRLLRKVVIAMEKPYPKGSIMMDAPPHDTMEDLTYLAGDHGYENHIKGSGMVSIYMFQNSTKHLSAFRNMHMRLCEESVPRTGAAARGA